MQLPTIIVSRLLTTQLEMCLTSDTFFYLYYLDGAVF